MNNQATNPDSSALTATEARAIAETIFSQLGGQRRLVLFTGANNFAFSHSTGFAVASFKLGRNSKGINHVSIELNGLDLYNLTFAKVRNHKATTVSELSDVYAEDLVRLFEEETGMFLSF